VGYNQAARPSEVDVLLPLRRDGRVLAQDRRLDGRHPWDRRPGRGATRADHCGREGPRRPA